MTRKEQIQYLLANPHLLIKKKPFTRGGDYGNDRCMGSSSVKMNEMVDASLPRFSRYIVPQSQFLEELDPECHNVLFDENVPSITMKIRNRYVEIQYKKMAIPFQEMIKNKHVLHLCGNPVQFTMMDTNPTDTQKECFTEFKQYWNLRNQDGMRTKMVDAQKSVGDAGLLYYFDYKGRIKSRLISYMDGYVLCPHNDENGDRMLEAIYYENDDIEYIDCYDDQFMYRFKRDIMTSSRDDGWTMEKPVEHGFEEIPLITKRGNVAWNDVQSSIEAYEILYNIFLVIQKRHGWGILYIKGKFKDDGKKIAGAIVLNDTSMDGNGSAEFKTPPSPQGTIDTLELMEQTIQKGGKCTFILPKDVKMSGDISGIAIMLTQELDIENALSGSIEWQNVADKMVRLFKYGLAKELVNNGKRANAIIDFANLDINAKFKVWRPQNDTEYNSMLIQLKAAGLISEKTGIQKNTESTPDEEMRRDKEREEAERKEKELQQQTNNTINKYEQ